MVNQYSISKLENEKRALELQIKIHRQKFDPLRKEKGDSCYSSRAFTQLCDLEQQLEKINQELGEKYAAFNRASGEILMYIPQELKADTQAMTRAIDDIFNAKPWADGEGHDLRQPAIHNALEQLYHLSEGFSGLGFKPPTSK